VLDERAIPLVPRHGAVPAGKAMVLLLCNDCPGSQAHRASDYLPGGYDSIGWCGVLQTCLKCVVCSIGAYESRLVHIPPSVASICLVVPQPGRVPVGKHQGQAVIMAPPGHPGAWRLVAAGSAAAVAVKVRVDVVAGGVGERRNV